ncbi:MAG TPA: HDIG domain-containing protein [Bacillota bacterium]|nr:HDIG domain-containing protein [Bacillota bacterium]
MIWRELLEMAEDKGITIWIVGGYLRDLFLGRDSHDLDLLVETEALNLARQLADRLAGTFVPLDPVRGVGRVVFRQGTMKSIDVAQIQGLTLEQDLKARDLTINSLALPISRQTLPWLDQLVSQAAERPLAARESLGPFLVDVCGGLEDLSNGLLRTNSLEILQQDPLRVLRVIRVGTILNFELEENTYSWLRVAAPGLAAVSGERVRDEVFHLLNSSHAAKGVEQAVELGILPVIFPEMALMADTAQNHHHKVDVWVHCLTTLRSLEELITWEELLPAELRKPLLDRLNSPFGKTGRTYSQLLKWVALFHDVGKPASRGIREDGRITFYGHDKAGSEVIQKMALRLVLSNREAYWAKKLVAMHMRPLMLYNAKGAGRQARYRFFRDLGEEALEVLALSLADMAAKNVFVPDQEEQSGYIGFVSELCREFLSRPEPLFPKQLVTGRDIVQLHPDISRSAIGQLLKKIRDKQGDGSIVTREQALNFIREVGEPVKGKMLK